MIGSNEGEDTFVSEHRWAVLTSLRADGQPVSSVVAYAREGDTLVVSTPGRTFKRRSIERDPRVTLTVISNQEPFNFVSVEGRAEVEKENIAPATRRVFENIAPAGYQEPEDLAAWLKADGRVIVRIHPIRTHAVIR